MSQSVKARNTEIGYYCDFQEYSWMYCSLAGVVGGGKGTPGETLLDVPVEEFEIKC